MKKILIIVLLLVIVLFGYLCFQKIHPNTTTLSPTPAQLPTECPSATESNSNSNFFASDDVRISLLPVIISPEPTVTPMDIVFDPKKPDDVWRYWNSPGGKDVNTDHQWTLPNSPWHEEKIDVDGDGNDEKILTANTAMNHTPHVLEIVKNNHVIFEARGANIWMEPTSDQKGFYLTETLDWSMGIYKKTRYIFEGGKFIPTFYQMSCAVE